MGTEVQQQVAVLALGYSSYEVYEMLLEELHPVIEEYLAERARSSTDSGGLYNILSSAVCSCHQGFIVKPRTALGASPL